MQRPEFKVDSSLAKLFEDLKVKKAKPEFGNPQHIRAIRYEEEKQEFIKKMKLYCAINKLDDELEINKALDTGLDYDVEISYRGCVTYTITAKSRNEAKKLAEDKFNSEWVGDLFDIEYEVEVQ